MGRACRGHCNSCKFAWLITLNVKRKKLTNILYSFAKESSLPWQQLQQKNNRNEFANCI